MRTLAKNGIFARYLLITTKKKTKCAPDPKVPIDKGKNRRYPPNMIEF